MAIGNVNVYIHRIELKYLVFKVAFVIADIMTLFTVIMIKLEVGIHIKY